MALGRRPPPLEPEATPQQRLVVLTSRAARFAAGAEHCSSQVHQKLSSWGAEEVEIQIIIQKLLEERLIDDARFASLYVRSKQRAGWGPLKIRAGLRQLSLPEALITTATYQLTEAAAESAIESPLVKLLTKKSATLTRLEPKARAERLFRFARQRGYATAEVLAALHQLGSVGPTEA